MNLMQNFSFRSEARIASVTSTHSAMHQQYIFICIALQAVTAMDRTQEFQRYDGWYNNLAHPDWGAVASHLYRKAPSKYADNVYMIDESLPSARALSDLVFAGPDGQANRRNVTTMMAFFAQVVAYEILQATQTACPLEMHAIQVGQCDKAFDPKCSGDVNIPFQRARYDQETGRGFNSPREQINEKTSWIDGSFLYSTSEPWVAAMRSFKKGRLKEGEMANYPPWNDDRIPLINPAPPQIHRLMDPERLFQLGDPRVNEHPGLLSFGLILYRWHNIQADRLNAAHPDWTDEDVFQASRRWVIASLQNIIVYEFLPVLLGTDDPLGAYTGYKSDLPPGITHEFAAAAFRFPHSLVPPGMLLRRRSPDGTCSFRNDVAGYPAIRLCQNWWNAQDIVQEYSVDEIILGMASQIAEADDSVIISDLRDYLFGPMHFTRMDLAAIGIMRGRDNGLPSYNQVRQYFGLPARTWDTINEARYRSDPVYRELVHNVEHLYNSTMKPNSGAGQSSIDRLDIYVGGMLEVDGITGPGQLFNAIIIDQFKRIRDADRFWFENRLNGIFTDADIAEIRNITLYDIIRQTTDIQDNHIQRNVFYFRPNDPCPQPYQVNSSGLEPCVPLLRLDHFMGNEVTFIFTCIALGIIPILCAGIGYLMVRRRRKWAGPLPHRPSARRARTGAVMKNNEPEVEETDDQDEQDSPVSLNNNNNIIDGNATLDAPTQRHAQQQLQQTDRSHRQNQANSVIMSNGDAKPKMKLSMLSSRSKKRCKLTAVEWLHDCYSRSVQVVVEITPSIRLEKVRGGLLRLVELQPVHNLFVFVSDDSENNFVLLSNLPDQHDMVLRFDCEEDSATFVHELEGVMREHRKTVTARTLAVDDMLQLAETKEGRQHKLEVFFREAYAKAFNNPQLGEGSTVVTEVHESVLTTMLTRSEFAEALGMRDNDLFIQRMFACVARRHPDKISFQEFLQTVHQFTNGSIEDRLRMVFDMCDRHQEGVVEREEFFEFMRSLKIAAGVMIDLNSQGDAIEKLIARAGISPNKRYLTVKDFEAIFSEVSQSQRPVGLHLRGTNQRIALEESESLQSFAITDGNRQHNWFIDKCVLLVAYLEDYRQAITWLTIFFSFCTLFFLERFWRCVQQVREYIPVVSDYRYESEHRDLRRVMGAGIAFTRGAAAAMSFCFGVIILTVCRNVLTLLRSTPLNSYIPLDKAIVFHKIVALTCGFFTVIHTVGHVINFYHVATQSKDGLQCLFQEAVFSSNFQPSISYWLYGTVTGITGILLVVVMSVIYVFAVPGIVSNAYYAFRITHFLNILLYLLTFLHGLPKLLDRPRFIYFIIVPACILVLDRILAMRGDYRKLQIVSATLLPSSVMRIRFKRPRAFAFISGQWVRVQCPAFSCNFNERHAFTLASPPHETTLTLYIKAVGPWTWKLYNEIQAVQNSGGEFPVLHLDGPYGAGNQDWHNFEVAVLIGGGIGVTPYASILTDLIHATHDQQHTQIACKKVYFLWICQNQKSFEWFVDVLRQVEVQDKRRVLDVHVFVTQFFHKFDLRTTMLYICEKHFRSEKGRSMFTDLRATNHFGRPNFPVFFRYCQAKHVEQRRIGVFSCGPPHLNRNIRDACLEANKNRNRPHFVHRYETF